MSDVTIEIDDTTQESPAIPPVVVIESETDSVPLWGVSVIERLTSLEQRVTELSSAQETTAVVALDASLTAELATDLADTALSVAVAAEEAAETATEIGLETADETGVLPEVIEAVSEPVPDAVPQKTHPLFRSLEDWRSALS